MLATLVGAAAVLLLVLRVPHGDRMAMHEYATGAGQRETVMLPDGTEFTLALASRLRVAADYADGDRQVVLDGEAFFNVAHDDAHPFSVRAQSAVALDIGTRFNVRAYNGDRAVRVIVSQGTVGVAARPGLHITTGR